MGKYTPVVHLKAKLNLINVVEDVSKKFILRITSGKKYELFLGFEGGGGMAGFSV